MSRSARLTKVPSQMVGLGYIGLSDVGIARASRTQRIGKRMGTLLLQSMNNTTQKTSGHGVSTSGQELTTMLKDGKECWEFRGFKEK